MMKGPSTFFPAPHRNESEFFDPLPLSFEAVLPFSEANGLFPFPPLLEGRFFPAGGTSLFTLSLSPQALTAPPPPNHLPQDGGTVKGSPFFFSESDKLPPHQLSAAQGSCSLSNLVSESSPCSPSPFLPPNLPSPQELPLPFFFSKLVQPASCLFFFLPRRRSTMLIDKRVLSAKT